MAFLLEYGVFLAKLATFAILLVMLIGFLTAQRKHSDPSSGKLEIQHINEQYEQITELANQLFFDKKNLKNMQKQQKKAAREQKKPTDKKGNDKENKKKLFVIDFKGSMNAQEVDNFSREVTAVISIAEPDDQVLVRLESPGGVVAGYGLGASQMARFKDAGIFVTVAVDKVAASGGYMMACVADRIVSAPFAMIGSIGVVAQLPNIHRLLKNNDVDVELHTAGDYKRTLTVIGENTDEGRKKFKQDLQVIHDQFKTHIANYRQQLDIEKVATGEVWLGKQAEQLQLVDEINTSDDLLMKAAQEQQLYQVRYRQKHSLAQRLGLSFAAVTEQLTNRMLTRYSNWMQ